MMFKRNAALATLAAICAGFGWTAIKGEPEFDLILRGGRILSGTSNPAIVGDVAIRNGIIKEVGRVEGRAKREIDVKGLTVCPGFIDVHTHAENVAKFPRAENFVRMGVTSIVIGNCGGSELDLGKFFRDLEKRGASVNVASLIGHNSVRRSAMKGDFNRAPTQEEMEAMRGLVRKAMEDGAVGLSTGLIYLPGTFSTTPEIIDLAKVAASQGGIYASHMRNESSRIDAAIEEFLAVVRGAGIRGELSHIKLGGESMWGKAGAILAKLDAARAEGLEITQDQYAYTASSTSLSVLIPDEYLEGGNEEFKIRIQNQDVRKKCAELMKETLRRRGGTDYAYAVISNCNSNKSLNGKNLRQASQILRNSDSLDSQIETVFQLQSAGGASCVFHGMSEGDVMEFMRHPNTMIASDSAIRTASESVPHPRGYGNNARVLGRYVREKGNLRLEDAVRKMTSLPAQTFRLKGRGLLTPGMAADIVVLDPATVNDPATYENPHQLAEGILFVLVNGQAVVEKGKHTGKLPGAALRGPGFRKNSRRS